MNPTQEVAKRLRAKAQTYRSDVRKMREDPELANDPIVQALIEPYRIVADELDKIAKEIWP